MRPYSVTIIQDPEKADLAPYFYSKILRLPSEVELAADCFRWFAEPVYLAIQPKPIDDDDGLVAGGFTGIQLNITPAKDLNPLVAHLRASGKKQPEPRELGDNRIMSVHDPSGNVIMIVGSDESPDEPTIDVAVGSFSIFVSDIEVARTFYVDTLGLLIRAEPYSGLLVLGADSGTALMVYQVAPDNPNTPIGRQTGLAFADPEPGKVLDRIEAGGGAVLDRVVLPPDADGQSRVGAGMFQDPDGNQFTLLSEEHLVH